MAAAGPAVAVAVLAALAATGAALRPPALALSAAAGAGRGGGGEEGRDTEAARADRVRALPGAPDVDFGLYSGSAPLSTRRQRSPGNSCAPGAQVCLVSRDGAGGYNAPGRVPAFGWLASDLDLDTDRGHRNRRPALCPAAIAHRSEGCLVVWARCGGGGGGVGQSAEQKLVWWHARRCSWSLLSRTSRRPTPFYSWWRVEKRRNTIGANRVGTGAGT